MSIASIISVVAALIIIGVFLVLAINVNYITKEIEQNLQVKVYINEDVALNQKEEIRQKLEGNSEVSEVEYETKAMALDNFKETLGEKANILNGYTDKNNPLLDSYIVKTKKSDDIESVYKFAKQIDGVYDVVYGQDVVDNLIKFDSLLQVVSLGIFAVLSVVSVFIIFNTTKLTVYARRNDITVMKYIGATDWYIRYPFLIEGCILGLLGAVIAALVIRNVYFYVIGSMGGAALSLAAGVTLAPTSMVIGKINLFFIIYGILIGTIGSGFSIRKFLNV